MNLTDNRTKMLQEIFALYLLAEAYDLRDLVVWCKSHYPSLDICREFRGQLLDAIQHPGLVTPQDYERWTLDDGYTSQELLQAHFRKIWNMCFPEEAVG